MRSSNLSKHSPAAWLSLGLVALTGLTACGQGSQKAANAGAATAAATGPADTVTSRPFGTVDGQPITEYTLRNAHGVTLRAMNYGGIILSLDVPDREGNLGDVVLGYDSLQDYLTSTTYFGAIIGRYGNRIANGRFTLDGKTYQLATNDGRNHLHGGVKGFDKRVWSAEPFHNAEGVGLVFHYTSPDGEEGYPGTLQVQVTYTLTDSNAVVFDFQATTDKPTPVNLTQHSYFNLTGGSRDILGHMVTINADSITPVRQGLIPTGQILPVAGTAFDFRTPRAIGDSIAAPDPQIAFGPGYDHNWVLNGPSGGEPRLAARVYEPTSGRVMEIYTDQPGMQFYSGNFLNGQHGKGGVIYQKHWGFAMETQHFPDSPNEPGFPSTILRPGETYHSRTIYKFSVQQ
jgi:aldose 1-epimerase